MNEQTQELKANQEQMNHQQQTHVRAWEFSRK